MIWAFEQKLRDDDEKEFYDHSKVDRSEDINTQMKQMSYDEEGLKKHWARKTNGYRLFGKYYEGLWD